MKIKTLHELFVHELQDIYSAELQILEALPKMIESATSPKLKQGFEKHQQETEEQVERLRQIAEELEFEVEGEMCKGIKGIIEEGDKTSKMIETEMVRDSALICAGQKVEHYEMVAYTDLINMATMMDHKNAVKLLQKTLKEEEATDAKLTKLAETEVKM